MLMIYCVSDAPLFLSHSLFNDQVKKFISTRGRYWVGTVRGRLPDPPVRGRLPDPPVRGRLSDPPVTGRLPAPPARGRWEGCERSIGRRWATCQSYARKFKCGASSSSSLWQWKCSSTLCILLSIKLQVTLVL